jgi:hypothetical protein
LLKRPGTIKFVIGQPITTAGKDPRVLNSQVEAWIDAKVAELEAARGG